MLKCTQTPVPMQVQKNMNSFTTNVHSVEKSRKVNILEIGNWDRPPKTRISCSGSRIVDVVLDTLPVTMRNQWFASRFWHGNDTFALLLATRLIPHRHLENGKFCPQKFWCTQNDLLIRSLSLGKCYFRARGNEH